MSDVVVLNVPNVAGALDAYPHIAAPLYERAAEAALLDVVGVVAEYPPKPPQSEYRRTGTLGRQWHVARPEFRSSATEFTASLGNMTSYGEFVQGDDQAWMHRGRWWPVSQMVKARADRLESFFEAAARQIEKQIAKETA